MKGQANRKSWSWDQIMLVLDDKKEKEKREIMLYRQMSFPFLYLPVQKACVYQQKSTVTHGTES